MDKIGGNNEKPWIKGVYAGIEITTIDPTHTIRFHDLNDIYIYIFVDLTFNLHLTANTRYL